MFFYHNSKKKSQLWDYSSLEHWTAVCYMYINYMSIYLYSQDLDQEVVTLFFSRDNPVEKLQLHLMDYSSVLVDCLEGKC